MTEGGKNLHQHRGSCANLTPPNTADDMIRADWLTETHHLSLTFIQPITEPVEDDALLAGGHQAYGAALHCGAIVDVVLKNENLKRKRRSREDVH